MHRSGGSRGKHAWPESTPMRSARRPAQRPNAASQSRQRLSQLPVIEAPQPAPASPAPAMRHAAPAVAASGPQAKKRNKWRIIFYAALVVFLASLLSLGFIAYSYWKERSTYSDLTTEVLDIKANSLADLRVDWNALRAINPETVGWIYIPDTQINYPIVQAKDNEKYLKTNFQGETNWVVSVGAIFLDMDNTSTFSDQNTIIYGHNMNDGSMFSDIVTFADPSVFNAHRDVYILTPSGNYRVRTFALIHANSYDPLVQAAFATDSERVSYIQDKVSRNVVEPAGALPTIADMTKIFTFSTCDNNQDNARYVLFGYVAESTVPGVSGLDQAQGVSRFAASNVNAGASDFASGNDVGD